MATTSALFRVPPLGHQVLGFSRTQNYPRAAEKVQISAGSLASLSTGCSSASSCGCSNLGIPAVPGLSYLGAWQQQQNSFSLLDRRVSASRSWKTKGRNPRMVTKAGMRLDPGGGGDGEETSVGRVIFNLALAGGLTYLTVTGKLGWLFDTIISLWLLAFLVPVVGVIVFLWFAEREIVTGACPNCGQSFQVFEFAAKEEAQFCPYCSQPFKLEDGNFIRDEPRFSNQRPNPGGFSGGFRSPFGGGFGQDKSNAPRKDESQEPGGIIVDVEAEVRDRD